MAKRAKESRCLEKLKGVILKILFDDHWPFQTGCQEKEGTCVKHTKGDGQTWIQLNMHKKNTGWPQSCNKMIWGLIQLVGVNKPINLEIWWVMNM
jgi:hypothetical protein